MTQICYTKVNEQNENVNTKLKRKKRKNTIYIEKLCSLLTINQFSATAFIKSLQLMYWPHHARGYCKCVLLVCDWFAHSQSATQTPPNWTIQTLEKCWKPIIARLNMDLRMVFCKRIPIPDLNIVMVINHQDYINLYQPAKHAFHSGNKTGN